MNRISMGIWGNTNLRDRFNIDGFSEDVSVIDRIKEVGETDGIDGVELHPRPRSTSVMHRRSRRSRMTTICRSSSCVVTHGPRNSTSSALWRTRKTPCAGRRSIG